MSTRTSTVPSVPPGHHFGDVVRRATFGPFILSEARYRAGLRTAWHAHHAGAFCLVLDGQYVQRFRGGEVEYTTSSVVFRPAGAEHTDRISPRGARCFIVEPDGEWLARAGLARLGSRSATGAALATRGQRATWLAEHALAELRSPDSATPLALEGLVLALGAELSRAADQSPEHRCPPWLRRTRETLDAEYDRRLSLIELAAAAGIHAGHLARSFRRHVGLSIGEYVRARRIEAACRALRDDDAPISEIALRLGFAHQSHFTRVFRERTGMTPLAYRRRRGGRGFEA
jgi:AraC family transcriptional regulator